MVAIPIGIYSAVRQYSIGDNIATILGYIGLATPGFLFALILMYLGQKWFGMSVGGLFSPEFEDAAWSWARFADMLSHLWVPVVVLGMAGTAFQLRTIRATLLDELNKMYVTAARAGGVPEFNLLIKYPVRMALNPIVATLGWELSKIVSGAWSPVCSCAFGSGYVFGRCLNFDLLSIGGCWHLYLRCTSHDFGSTHSIRGKKLKWRVKIIQISTTKKYTG